MSEENPIIGHKTFSDGLGFRHEPLRQDEAEAIMADVKRREAENMAKWPDERSALSEMCRAYHHLEKFGWAHAMYCPKDGTTFLVIEAGSGGIHEAYYQGEWPTGTYWVMSEGDLWPSRPILWKPKS